MAIENHTNPILRGAETAAHTAGQGIKAVDNGLNIPALAGCLVFGCVVTILCLPGFQYLIQRIAPLLTK